MSLPGFGSRWSPTGLDLPQSQEVILQRPLSRIMAFLGLTIDAVCNDPIARGRIACYYKLHLEIQRSMETTELNRQWSGPDSYY